MDKSTRRVQEEATLIDAFYKKFGIRNAKLKKRQGFLPAALVLIPCKSILHLQFPLHDYEYCSSSEPTAFGRLL